MKKGWVLVLLISLGLNLGLGVRLLGDRGGADRCPDSRLVGEIRGPRGRWAKQDSVARKKMFTRRLERIADALGLDPEQREVFREVHMKTGRMLMQKRVLIAEKRGLLHTLVTSERIDQDGIREAIAELGRQQAVLDSLVAETVLQEMEILEPGQRARYLELLPFDKGGGGPRRGPGGRGARHQ
ncbi:MAG: periplasmic heavy metal sensor [Candidatus Krumholzibacteriota bacterium]